MWVHPNFFYVTALLSGLCGVSSAFSVTEIGKSNFEKYRHTLPPTFNPVSAGGWHAVYEMAADPKAELLALVTSGLKDSSGAVTGGATGSDKLDTLIYLLESQGKGFKADLVDGDWALILSREAKKSPKFQKAVDGVSKTRTAFSNFDIDKMEFINKNYTPRGNGLLQAILKYDTSTAGFSKTFDGKIALRRVTCNIVDVSFKYWKLPKLKIPLRVGEGYLDFLYLDNDIRITRGNRGGLFVHARPDFFEKIMAE